MSNQKTKDISGFEEVQNKSPQPKGKNYLLAIAIDQYDEVNNGIPKLSNCVKDANGLIAVLQDRYSFQPENIFKLFNKAATKGQINKKLDDLSENVTEADNVIIYFSGHGYYIDRKKEGYLIPVEGKVDENKEAIYWNFLSNNDFLTSLRAIKSFHTFLIVDSCFSGSLFATKDIGDAFAAKAGSFPSRWGLAAGMIEKVSDGFHGDNSPFAKAIITFLEKTKAQKNPVSDLIQYVKKATANNADQTPIGGPLFKVGDMNGEYIFEVTATDALEAQIDETAAKETAAFEKAKKSKNAKKLIQFLNTSKNPDHKNEILKILEQVENEESWKKVNKQSYVSLFRFVSAFPFHSKVEEAKTLMEKLQSEPAIAPLDITEKNPPKIITRPPAIKQRASGEFSIANQKSLLAKNKIQKVFDNLEQWISNQEDQEDLQNQLILLQGQYNSLLRESRLGTISANQDSLQRNKINYALLSLLDEVQEVLESQPQKEIDNILIDPRDGRQYKTVELKDGNIWMAENLNFDAGEDCAFYDNDPNIGEQYGRLYTWEAAVKSCPAGWHIPDQEDWANLISLYGKGKADNEIAAYQALVIDGDVGFLLKHGGSFGWGEAAKFTTLEEYGLYWSGNARSKSMANYYFIGRAKQEMKRDSTSKLAGLSVRCIKDK